MKKHLTKKRVILLALVIVALAIASGVAYAYWTSSGSGTGSATAGTTSDVVVHQTSTVTGLYPGGPTVTLSGNFDNPNSGAVHISSVTATVTGITGGGNDSGKPACTAADFTIGGSAAGSTVPTGNGVGSWTGLTVQMVDGAANQDNCKGASATIAYTANP
jgi:hypothetical protein